MMRLSTALKNARADAMETLIGAAPTLELRSGPPPADIAAAATGALLVSMTLPADWLSAASGGVKTGLGQWSGPAAGAGFVGHYRIVAGASCHLDGHVSQPWAASAPFGVGQQCHIGGRLYRCVAAGVTAAGGGPTGTGAGVADGGVTWDYVGAPDMTMDNTSVTAGQIAAVTFSWTEVG